MANAKGMRSQKLALTKGEAVVIFSDPDRIILQVKRDGSTGADPLASSFTVAVELNAYEALTIAEGLLSIVVGQSKDKPVTLSSNRPYTAPA
jgi:hypothetical protein